MKLWDSVSSFNGCGEEVELEDDGAPLVFLHGVGLGLVRFSSFVAVASS